MGTKNEASLKIPSSNCDWRFLRYELVTRDVHDSPIMGLKGSPCSPLGKNLILAQSISDRLSRRESKNRPLDI